MSLSRTSWQTFPRTRRLLNKIDSGRCQRFAIRLAKSRHLIERGSKNIPAVALTFDDGPSPRWTPPILRILEEHQIHATFFCIGAWMKRYAHIVERAADAGHLIGNHTQLHLDLALSNKMQIVKQINKTSNLQEKICGQRPAFLRIPFGSWSTLAFRMSFQLGMINVGWSVDSYDWRNPGADQIVNQVLKTSFNGGIILLHDGGGDRSQTVAALPLIIRGLKARGFAFQRVDEMLAGLPMPS